MSTTHFGDKTVKIRKAVYCWGCEDRYDKGSILKVSKGIFDDSFYSCYWCPICYAYQKSIHFSWLDYDNGIQEGDFRQHHLYEDFRKKYIEKYEKTGILV